MELFDLPLSMTDEYKEYIRLFALGSTRTSTGDPSFTSTSSGSSVVYQVIDNTGENGILALLKEALRIYMPMASDINGKIDKTDYVNHAGYAVATGSANTYVLTLTDTPTAYVDGFYFSVKINTDNTSASTVNVNSLGAKSIKNPDGSDVSAKDLLGGGIYTMRYNAVSDTMILQGAGNSTNIQKNFTTQLQIELDADDNRFSGTKKSDASCWSGKCIYATTSTSGSVALTDITVNNLRFLEYNLLIRLKSGNNALSTNGILIDVQKNVGGTFTSFATNYIKANEFTNTTDYQTFAMGFEYTGVKATNNQIKIIVTLQTQASAYEVDLDSIVILPVGLGTFLS